MGGYGSGRWRGYRRKLTVEECYFLDINEMVRDGLRNRGTASVFIKSGHLRKEKVSSVSYTFESFGNTDPTLDLEYTVTTDGKEQYVSDAIRLQTTPLYTGGLRWWFTCPLVSDGKPCQRRVGKLFLPPGGLYFGCRHCYGLTYRSCQESHKIDLLCSLIAQEFPGLTPKQVKRILSY